VSNRDVIVVGASAGGVDALRRGSTALAIRYGRTMAEAEQVATRLKSLLNDVVATAATATEPSVEPTP
jgi:hypothetical protein